MKRFLRTVITNVAVALTLGAAVPAHAQAPAPLPGSGRTPALGVTHENQGDTSWCNFYALAAILRYHNSQNARNRIQPVRGPGGLVATAVAQGWHDGGTDTALDDRDFVRLAERLGYSTVTYTGTFGADSATSRRAALNRLLSELRAGRPPGIGLPVGGGGHAYVVSGVRTNAAGEVTHILLTHSGPAGAGADQPMAIDEFMNRWARFDFNLIAVIPPNPRLAGAAAARAGGAAAAGMYRD